MRKRELSWRERIQRILCERGGLKTKNSVVHRHAFARLNVTEPNDISQDVVTFSRVRYQPVTNCISNPRHALPFVMTTSAHCSPSRSSLSCCQFDRISENDVRDSTMMGNNNYFLQQEKRSFPKRPEIDLAFRNVRYRVKKWNIRKCSAGEYQEVAI